MAKALEDVGEGNADMRELEEKVEQNPQIGGMLLRRMTTMNADRKSVMGRPNEPLTEDKDDSQVPARASVGKLERKTTSNFEDKDDKKAIFVALDRQYTKALQNNDEKLAK
jgi:hypothetical protein